jgi:hypothetical protein
MAKQELDVHNTATDDFFETLNVETLAEQQGVGPLDFARARRLGRFWPQDESIDDFVATVRRWRDEEGGREMPVEKAQLLIPRIGGIKWQLLTLI